MIVTKQQQEAIVEKYMDAGNRSKEEVHAFIDGIEAAFKLVDKILSQNSN